MKKTKYYYLAGPYSTGIPEGQDPEIVMTERAAMLTESAAALMHYGITVFSPITHGCAIESFLPLSDAKSHGFWMNQCEPLVRNSSGVIKLMLPDWHLSDGRGNECVWANEDDLPIYPLLPGREQQLAMLILALPGREA